MIKMAQKVGVSFFSSLALFGLMFCLPGDSIAEESEGPEQGIVVRHEPRKGLPFDTKTKQTFKNLGMVFKVVPKEVLKERKKQRERVKKGPYYLPKLAACEMPRVRRDEVFHSSLGTQGFDVVFFDAEDKQQINTAKKSKLNSIAYKGGRTLDLMKYKTDSPLQRLASTLGIKCLPTRFHFVTEDNKRFIEYREGLEAWASTSSEKS